MKRNLLGLAIFAGVLVGCNQGPVGPVGPEGAPGNANVFSVNFTFSVDDAIINGNVASVQFDVPGISPRVVDEGAVLVFFRDQGTWTSMPFVFSVESEDLAAVDYTINMAYGYDDEFLEVFYETSVEDPDFARDVFLDQPNREMKAVIIDGFFSKTHVDLTDYDAVAEHYGLK
ncbi:MAG: hypothetical protein HKN43_08980 [Rhodothermales bacterium]|nr:hypothetical protein [Rhodothermales bacterium]